VLDRGFPGWRQRTRWERHGLFDGGAGAADPPGSSWRDRPALERGDDVWLAGDCVAAPGMLAEVACESARRAPRPRWSTAAEAQWRLLWPEVGEVARERSMSSVTRRCDPGARHRAGAQRSSAAATRSAASAWPASFQWLFPSWW
jgi:hypothetical protein